MLRIQANRYNHMILTLHPCVTQLLEFLEDITQAIDDGNDVDVIYLDFCKAFNKVPHKRLLKKMYGYGIRGKIHSWVKEFLSEREQRVTVNGSQSSWKHIDSVGLSGNLERYPWQPHLEVKTIYYPPFSFVFHTCRTAKCSIFKPAIFYEDFNKMNKY